MRLHTRLTYGQVYDALKRAKDAGKVTSDVSFVVDEQFKSQTHDRAFEIQLGTYDKNSLPRGYKDQHGHTMHVRRYKNGGNYGAASEWGRGEAVWAATWDEWGWFIREVFDADPHSRWGGTKNPNYDGADDFHNKTHGAFKTGGPPRMGMTR